MTDGRFKLIFPHTYNSNEGCLQGRDGQPGDIREGRVETTELYDLRTDPGERYNIAAAAPMSRPHSKPRPSVCVPFSATTSQDGKAQADAFPVVSKESLTYPENDRLQKTRFFARQTFLGRFSFFLVFESFNKSVNIRRRICRPLQFLHARYIASSQ